MSTANHLSLLHPHHYHHQACIRIAAAIKLTSTPFPIILMEPWCRSNITPQRLECLVHCGLLRPLTAAEEWRLPGNEDEPSPPEGYVMSFALFHERGFAILAHKFLRGLLDYYQVESQWSPAYCGIRRPV